MMSIQPERAAALYEGLPFPVVIVDGDAMAVGVNGAGRRALGLTGDVLPETSILDGVDGAALRSLALLGRETTHVLRFRRADGSVFEATAHVIALEPGSPAGAHAILLRSLLSGGSHGENLILGNRISSALDTIPEGFAIFDRSERLVMFNKAFRDRCGPARHAVRVGATLESIVRENIRLGVYTDIREGTPEAEAWVADRLSDHRHPDSGGAVFAFSEDRWMRSESHVTEDGDIVALRLDITEIKRAELALEAKRKEYLSLLQNMPNMICRFTPDRIIRFCNDRYAAIYGFSSEAMIGMDILKLVPAEFHERTIDSLAAFSREKPANAREILQVLPDGSGMWVKWDVTAIFDGECLMDFLVVGRDITEAKAQELHVSRQNEELQRKNQALDQFTATVSHDLKAPLRHLSMFSEMLVDDFQRDRLEDLPLYAGHIQTSSQRMTRLIESLLEFSQIAHREIVVLPVDLRFVVDEALLLLESHILETDAEIDLGPLPEVHGDADLLVRLAQNLIGNALKYHAPGERPCVRIYARQTADAVEFVVEDKGIGVDVRRAGRIFEVFQRLHRDESTYKGTGIGLAIAKRIAESHNAVITLDTDYAPGARFIVAFPILSVSRAERPWEIRQKS